MSYIVIAHCKFQSYIISFYFVGNSVSTYTSTVTPSLQNRKQLRITKGVSQDQTSKKSLETLGLCKYFLTVMFPLQFNLEYFHYFIFKLYALELKVEFR
jgi:hypothetical protein